MANALVNPPDALQQWRQAQLEIQQLKVQLLQEQETLADTRGDLIDRQVTLDASRHRVGILQQNIATLKEQLQQEKTEREALKTQLRDAEKAKIEQEDQAELHLQRSIDLRRDLAVKNQIILGLNREMEAVIRIKNRDILIRNLVIAILDLKLKIAEEEIDKAYVISTTVGLEIMVAPWWGAATAATLLVTKGLNGNIDNGKQANWRQQIQEYQRMLQIVKRMG